jgi:hypothetical protein
MAYSILVNGVEVVSTTCPNNAVALAMLAGKAHGDAAVTCESHSVWGQYAAPELVGKPCVSPYNWKQAKQNLMGY